MRRLGCRVPSAGGAGGPSASLPPTDKGQGEREGLLSALRLIVEEQGRKAMGIVCKLWNEKECVAGKGARDRDARRVAPGAWAGCGRPRGGGVRTGRPKPTDVHLELVSQRRPRPPRDSRPRPGCPLHPCPRHRTPTSPSYSSIATSHLVVHIVARHQTVQPPLHITLLHNNSYPPISGNVTT